MSEDPYGLKVSSSGPAFDAWLSGLDASLAFDKSGITELENAVSLDPDFALAYATLARQQFNYGFQQEARSSLDKALAVTDSITAREASQVNVAEAAMRYNPKALEIARAHLEEWPTDVFVFSHIVGPFGLLAFSGRQNWRSECVDVLEHYRHHWPEDDWWFLATLAFSLAETGSLDQAEIAAQRALQIRPTGNCAHSMSHVHFEQEAADTAYAFLDQWISRHGRNSDMRHHLIWHTALLDLEEGKASHESMLDLYRRELDPKVSDPQPLTTFSDNAAILWRCAAHGMPLPQEFAIDTFEYGERHYPAVGFPFADIHKIISSILTHPQDPGEELLNQLGQLEDRKTADLMTGLWQGFTAFAGEDYSAAVDWLQPLLTETVRLGGSNPQRRIVEETYFAACTRSGKTTSAVELLRNRLAARTTRHDQQLLAQLLSVQQ